MKSSAHLYRGLNGFQVVTHELCQPAMAKIGSQISRPGRRIGHKELVDCTECDDPTGSALRTLVGDVEPGLSPSPMYLGDIAEQPLDLGKYLFIVVPSQRVTL